MNFVFISPQFPYTYYRFCKALKKDGVRVLGIGDTPYDSLSDDLKEALDEYYYVDSLSNYEAKRNAVKYFNDKYGKIDYIESNNEFWLYDDACLRDEFKVTTGPNKQQIISFRNKSEMKKYYKEANVKTARYILVDDLNSLIEFANKVSYPIITKPNDGMGASKTIKIRNEIELRNFYNTKEKNVTFIAEEFVNGDLISYDGVCDSNSNVVYPTHHVFDTQIMDVVNNNLDVYYYTNPIIPEDLDIAGRNVIKAFKAKSRFFHLEFFRLREDKDGLGKKGDLIGLEVNMRVPGGYTPDLINFAYSIDIYQIWADVMAFDKNNQKQYFPKQYACYVGRRNYVIYEHCYEEIMQTFKYEIVFNQGMPEVLSAAMGDYFFMAKFKDKERMNYFIQFITKRK